MDPLFTTQYHYQLYQVMESLQYPDIVNLCRTNKSIGNLCRTDSEVQRILLNKEIDQYLLKSKNDLNIALIDAIQDDNLPVVDELLKRGADLPLEVMITQLDERLLEIMLKYWIDCYKMNVLTRVLMRIKRCKWQVKMVILK